MTDKKASTSTPTEEATLPAEHETEGQLREEQIRRIGILQCISRFDDSALRYLILRANSYQNAFQFEFLPFNDQDEFIAPLLGSGVVGRNWIIANMGSFFLRQRDYLRSISEAYGRTDEPPRHFQLISEASFRDNYFYTSDTRVAVIALGGWERSMSPPSILEFIQALVLQDTVFGVCPELSTHLGTRGCLFDFCAQLSDVRQKVLAGFICKSCQATMSSCGHSELVEDLDSLLAKKWLGSPADPSSPAGIAAKLGHDLFITKGLKPNLLESIKMSLINEGTKEILKVLAAVIIAALLVFLGLSVAQGKANSTGSPSPHASSSASQAKP